MRNLIWLFLALFFIAFNLYARDVEILVIDADLSIPLEGAIVRSWDSNEYICGEDGRVILEVPQDRQVSVRAVYPGYQTGRIIITTTGSSFTIALRLTGVMESRELIIEASRPGENETRTGRSIALSGREMSQSSEIGLIEDVMSSIKLLPGVGFSGFFNAQPSIRGGYPGDMRASLDGFYILNPFHWGGGYSIFDPRIVESAQLSHGVFSSRYGHSISGLLEVTTKKPSPTETQIELGVSSSTSNLSLSLPINNRGGVLIMGRVTYYDPVVALAMELGKTIEELSIIDYISTAPYIRSCAITGNYRFTNNLEFTATGFFGMDGVGASFSNHNNTALLETKREIVFDWTNYQGFVNLNLLWNPRKDMLLKFTTGIGFEDTIVDGVITDYINNKLFTPSYELNNDTYYKQSDQVFNVQGRIDYDWELGSGFLISAGAEEMFTQYKTTGENQIYVEKRLSSFSREDQDIILGYMGYNPADISDEFRNSIIVSIPLYYEPNAENMLFATSGYILAEYSTPGGRFKTELGVRMDHYYLQGSDFSLSSIPAISPRLNIDFNIYSGSGFVSSFDISAGTGLFSSMDNNLFVAEGQYNISEIKPNRSWTSVLGTKLELADGYTINIEGYYKYIFDRMYVPVSAEVDGINVRPQFNGEGRVWGIDLFLQKVQSRYWDGWLSYSYSWAKYRDPDAGNSDIGLSGGVRGDDWYFPSFHRFHNLNLVLNFKPAQNINIYTRFGLASGIQIPLRLTDSPSSYPVFVYDPANPENNQLIELFYWPSIRDENNRTTLSLPWDIKLSISGANKSGKTLYEVYVAVENILALWYTAEGNTMFSKYTGQIHRGSDTPEYEMPIPIPSFGFKMRY